MNEQKKTASSKLCPECGGERVRAQAGPYVFQLTPEQSTKFFKPSSGTVALVCTSCGYVSWYATDPEKLIVETSNQE